AIADRRCLLECPVALAEKHEGIAVERRADYKIWLAIAVYIRRRDQKERLSQIDGVAWRESSAAIPQQHQQPPAARIQTVSECGRQIRLTVAVEIRANQGTARRSGGDFRARECNRLCPRFNGAANYDAE